MHKGKKFKDPSGVLWLSYNCLKIIALNQGEKNIGEVSRKAYA